MAVLEPTLYAGASEDLVRGEITDIQRRRLLAAAAEAIAEVGSSKLTVAEIIRRAGVSRKTFYEIFTGCEDCLLSTLEVAIAEASLIAREAYLGQRSWQDKIRAAVTQLLVFFEENPDRASLILVESCAAGDAALERRAEVLRQLAAVIHTGTRPNARFRASSPLLAEGVVGGVVAVVQTRVQRQPTAPLVDLGAQLMSILVLPYLGPAAARRELSRAEPKRRRGVGLPCEAKVRLDPIAGLNMRLTYRTVQVLQSIRDSPDASNRAIAEACGIVDQGQISKLVSRLERLGLLENRGQGPTRGAANAWHLTPRGGQLVRAVQAY
jgi:AcrR family transcriptional regulator/DNA-binding MarR family transcriptional regulator